jgi:hypothetical protein
LPSADRHPAASGDERRQRQRVRADDLVWADRLARHHHLVAGRQDADHRPAMDEEPRPVHRRGETDVARRQARSGMEQHLALGEIEPGAAHVSAELGALDDADDVAVALGVFLDDDRVGAFGERRTGEDARRLALTDNPGKPGARRDFGDDAQISRHRRDIGGAHRVAVHRRDRERRLGAARGDILGEHAADRVRDRHLLGRQGFEGRQQPRQGFFDRDHGFILPRARNP